MAEYYKRRLSGEQRYSRYYRIVPGKNGYEEINVDHMGWCWCYRAIVYLPRNDVERWAQKFVTMDSAKKIVDCIRRKGTRCDAEGERLYQQNKRAGCLK